MKTMVICEWEEVEAVLESGWEELEWKLEVKPYLLRKGFGVVSMKEVREFEETIKDLQEELKLLKGFVRQNLETDPEPREQKTTEQLIEAAKVEAEESKSRSFEEEKARLRALLEAKKQKEEERA